MRSTISSKGQITVPSELRRKLGLKAGMTLEFDENADYLLARPAFDEGEMDSVFGIAREYEAGKCTRQILRDQRGYERDDL